MPASTDDVLAALREHRDEAREATRELKTDIGKVHGRVDKLSDSVGSLESTMSGLTVRVATNRESIDSLRRKHSPQPVLSPAPQRPPSYPPVNFRDWRVIAGAAVTFLGLIGVPVSTAYINTTSQQETQHSVEKVTRATEAQLRARAAEAELEKLKLEVQLASNEAVAPLADPTEQRRAKAAAKRARAKAEEVERESAKALEEVK